MQKWLYIVSGAKMHHCFQTNTALHHLQCHEGDTKRRKRGRRRNELVFRKKLNMLGHCFINGATYHDYLRFRGFDSPEENKGKEIRCEVSGT